MEYERGPNSLGRHHGVELLVVDLAVTVDVRLLNHGIDLVARQLLAQVHHDHGQLLPVDVAVAVLQERSVSQIRSCSANLIVRKCTIGHTRNRTTIRPIYVLLPHFCQFPSFFLTLLIIPSSLFAPSRPHAKNGGSNLGQVFTFF